MNKNKYNLEAEIKHLVHMTLCFDCPRRRILCFEFQYL